MKSLLKTYADVGVVTNIFTAGQLGEENHKQKVHVGNKINMGWGTVTFEYLHTLHTISIENLWLLVV